MARRVPIALLVVIVPAAALAGCLADDPSEDLTATAAVPPLTVPPTDALAWVDALADPTGDAYYYNGDMLLQGYHCPDSHVPGVSLDDACDGAATALSATGTQGAVAAPPGLDITALRLAPYDGGIVVSIDVAGLEPDFAGLHDPETGRAFTYIVRLVHDSGCDVVPVLWGTSGTSALVLNSYAVLRCPDDVSGGYPAMGECRDYCLMAIPWRIDAGTPGAVSVFLPAWVLPAMGGGLAPAIVVTLDEPPEDGLGAYIFARTAAVDFDEIEPFGDEYATDVAVPGGRDSPLVPFVPRAYEWGTSVMKRGEARIPTGGEPVAEEHLESLHVAAEGPFVTFTVTFGALRETARNLTFVAATQLDGAGLVLRARGTPSGWTAGATMSVWEAGTTTGLPVVTEFTYGAPGAITFRVDRTLLPAPGEWTHTTGTYAMIYWLDAPTVTNGGLASAGAEQYRYLDMLPMTDPVTLPPLVPDGAGTVRFSDARNDVDLPPDVIDVGPPAFDLERLEWSGDDPDEIRVTLGVRDTGTLPPPRGYDAIFYAAAFEHPRGTTMLGHYRSAERPGGVFLCAPDTTVFQSPAADPAFASWLEIPGRLVAATKAAGGGGGGTGGGEETTGSSIIMFVPRSCFDMRDDELTLTASAGQAGAYLIRRSEVSADGSEVHTADTWSSDAPVTLTYAERAVIVPTFWERPFGVSNFWDIAGAFLAFVTIIVTIAIVQRRRRMLRIYLDEIRRIQEELETEPTKRAIALVELRKRLQADLESHRVTDNHFPIIMDRLRSRLTSARLTSVGEAFYDLPPPLAMRLERLLDDGHLSTEEGKVLKPLIDRARMPKASKDTLLARVERWMFEDQEEKRTA